MSENIENIVEEETPRYVKFLEGKLNDYLNLEVKDNDAFYLCTDTQQLYKGDKLAVSGVKIITHGTSLPSGLYEGVFYDTVNNELIVRTGAGGRTIPLDRTSNINSTNNEDEFLITWKAAKQLQSLLEEEIEDVDRRIDNRIDNHLQLINSLASRPSPVQSDMSLEFDTDNLAYIKNVPWRSTYTLNNTPIGVSQSITYGNLNSHIAFYNNRLGAEYEIKVPEIKYVFNNIDSLTYGEGELYTLTLNNQPFKFRLIRVGNGISLCRADIPVTNASDLIFVNAFYTIATFHKSEDDSTIINEAPGTIVKGYFTLNANMIASDVLRNSYLLYPDATHINLTPIWEKAPELTTGKTYNLTFDAGEGAIIEGYNTSKVTFSINNGDSYKDIVKKLPKAYKHIDSGSSGEYSYFTTYSFDKWYWDKYNYTLYEDDFETGYFAVNEDVTLHAVWNPNQRYYHQPDVTYRAERYMSAYESLTSDGHLRFKDTGNYISEDGESISITGTFFDDYSENDYIEECCNCGQVYKDAIQKSVCLYDNEGNFIDYYEISSEAPLLMADGYIHTGWYCEQYNYTLSLDDYFAIGNTAYWNLKRYVETKHSLSADKLPDVDWNATIGYSNRYGIKNKPFGIDFTIDSNTAVTIPGTYSNRQILTFDKCYRKVSSWCTYDYLEYVDTSRMNRFCEDNTFLDDVTIKFGGREWETSYDEETETSTYTYYTPVNPLKIGKMYLCKIEDTLYMCDEVFNGKTIPENHKFLFTITPSADNDNNYYFDIIDFDYKVLEDYLYINHDIPSDYIIDWDGASYSLAIAYIEGKLGKYTINKINPVYLSDASDVTVEDIEKMWKELNTWGTVTHMEDGSIVLECPHPYISDIDEEWEFSFDESYTHIDLTFDEQTTFEDNCDYLVIVDYDGNENQCGNEVAGTTLTIGGSYVKIKFHSDGSVEHYGFKVTITPTSYEVE